jgi:Fe-S oxidoreductase
MDRRLMQYLDICARCAICKDACHQYVGTQDLSYLPARRADLLRRLYRRHMTPAGKVLPSLFGSADAEQLLDELERTAYACTGCRRCMYYCPFSIDTHWVLASAKAMLIAAGRESRMLGQLADAAIFKGDNLEMFRDTLVESLTSVGDEVRDVCGIPTASIPIDKPGADMLYVALSGAHTVTPAAAIFEAAGANWTLSLFEAANYGYFLGDKAKALRIADRFIDEARRLEVSEIVITECGHAYRIANMLYEAWSGEKLPFRVRHILEVIDEYLAEGRLKVTAPIDTPITYHDPCQLGRNGGVFDAPRRILAAIATDVRELTPNRERQWCCGGGGGLVALTELDDMRMASGLPKAEQISATGASIVASPCENCRLQIQGLNQHYDLGVKVTGVMDLAAEAICGRALGASGA